jgi:hypothetical protein
VGVITGVLGIVSVAGPYFARSLGVTIVIASTLTAVWVVLVGYRLYRLSWS